MRRPLAILCVGTCAVLAGGLVPRVGVAEAASTSAQKQPRKGTSLQDQTTVLAATPADNVYAIGTTNYANAYAGMDVLSADESAIRVYLTSDSADAEMSLTDAAGNGTRVSFTIVPQSAVSLAGMVNAVSDSSASLTALGLHITSYFPDPATGTLDVGLTDLTPDSARLFHSVLPNIPVAFHQEAPSQPTVSRIDDFSPWVPGDAIYDLESSGYNGCTLGFSIFDAGVNRLLTAAHCFSIGNSVRNGMVAAFPPRGSRALIGTSNNKAIGDGLD